MKLFSFRGLPVIDSATRDPLGNGCLRSVGRFLRSHPDVQYVLRATACVRRSTSNRDFTGQYDRIVSRPKRTVPATGGLR